MSGQGVRRAVYRILVGVAPDGRARHVLVAWVREKEGAADLAEWDAHIHRMSGPGTDHPNGYDSLARALGAALRRRGCDTAIEIGDDDDNDAFQHHRFNPHDDGFRAVEFEVTEDETIDAFTTRVKRDYFGDSGLRVIDGGRP